MNKHPAVCILASERNGTLYIGVTSDLVERIWEHKKNIIAGFTKRYAGRYCANSVGIGFEAVVNYHSRSIRRLPGIRS